MSRLHRDERGIVVSFLIKTLLALALVGLVTVEATAVVFARVQAQDVAQSAANEAARQLQERDSLQGARQAAESLIADRDPRLSLRRFTVQSDGTVTVVVRKRASTVVIQHIGFLEGFAVARGRGVGHFTTA